MDYVLKRRRMLSIWMIIAMIWTTAGIAPAHADTAKLTKVVLVGDLQSKLGHSSDWDADAAATEMISLGNGNYSFTGNLPAGTYQYKVAVGGNWDESYGFSNYTDTNGAQNDGNIQLTITEDNTAITFYYNHYTHCIADSTYYLPIAADKLPRIVGDLQTVIGDTEKWKPEAAKSIMDDADLDGIYSITKTVPKGTYEYKIVLGSTEEDQTYPEKSKVLILPQKLPVTFKYNMQNHAVTADFTVPVDSSADPVPANHLRVHYNRVDGNYENQGLWLWDHVKSPSTNWSDGATPFPAGKIDSFGAYVDIPLADGASKVGFLVVNRKSGVKDGGNKAFDLSSPELNEVWIQEGSDKVYSFIPVVLPEQTVRVHYARSDGNQGAYGLWLWGQVAEVSTGWPAGAAAFSEEHVDRYGAYIDIPLQKNAEKINLIVVNRTSGDKDGGDKAFNFLSKYNQLWLKEGDDNVYVSPHGEVPVGLVSAEILSDHKLLLGFSMTDGLDVEELKNAITIKDKNGDDIVIDQVVIKGDTSIEVLASIPLDKAPLSVTYSGKTVSAAAGWRMMDEMYNYEGNDLGAAYKAGGVDLKLWAPKASAVRANFFDKSDSTKLVGSIDLTKGDKGVWSVSITPSDSRISEIADWKGYFYQYEVTNDGVTKKVLDPYAKSMAEFRVNTKGQVGPDGDAVGKAAIIDLSETNPNAQFDFANIDGYEKREDAIIWEAHIRDFTSDPSISEGLHDRWGTYSAFIDKLDYIKSLGVTHVQLLPVMAWYYGDEANMTERELEYSAQDNEYNWGYDPHNYFSPDGAYSENAKNPELRVKELKGLIDAIHDAGMGVILDVVYTHMAKADFLNDIVPNYYAFQDANGNNIGGFGNNLATNHKMAEKLMVDSVKYWFDEYKIDGMRWDMMGDATYDSVQHAYDAAASINPKALFIGEGWRTFGGAASDPSLAGKGADQDWMDKTDNVGVFSDEIRNELKSGFGSEGEPRFITGGARSINTIFNNIKAQPSNTPADAPGDMVQYIEAHDNLPLYDVIAQSIKKDPAVPANDLEIHKRIRLGNMLILTSQGTAFLHAGQEYGRTKQWLAPGKPEQKYHELFDDAGVGFGYFVHDSYDSSDAINKFDWQKATNAELFPINNETRDYTAGLIQLRKYTDAFRLGDKNLVNANVTLIEAPEVKADDLVIGYKNKATDGTGEYYVFMNADNKERTITLSQDLTSGTVIADNDEAGIKAVSAPSGFELTASSIKLDPLTAVIIRMESAAPTTPNTSVPSTHNADAQVIQESSLQNGRDGKVSLTIDTGKAAVLLPLKAAAILGKNDLELRMNGLTVTLPNAVLAGMPSLVKAGDTDGSRILFQAKPLTEAAVSSIMNSMNVVQGEFKAGSQVYEFKLSVITSEGTAIEVTKFEKPIIVAFMVSESVNTELIGIYYISDNGKPEYVGGVLNGNIMTSQLFHFSKYTVLERNKSFSDVSASHWASSAIKALAAKGIVTGISDTQFAPQANVTRAEFAAMLIRALGVKTEGRAGNGGFADVSADKWYSAYVATAVELGIVKGRSDKAFAPNATISREEMAVMIVRAYEVKIGKASEATAKQASFADGNEISSWAAESVAAAEELGLVQGSSNGRYMPKSQMTRAESAKAIYNLLGK
ncbi:secreted pullulanase [Paenibacillus castaneae]|uniref:pullulanase n=1 Tax=Paenibacillus castaneae TaxID=474957 RepID=UPI000C9A60C1|nr:pullulanase [Paenibacillus castaneae]NIK77843.1 secreted pullulanase [Paenibacillus castaneae]